MRTAAALLLACAAAAQQLPTFTAGTQLVIETVSVTDKQGAPIEGLTAADFTVTEDGAPQQIRVFEYQRLPGAPAPPARPESTVIYQKLNRTAISLPSGGYRDRRLLALYFDMTSMQPAGQLRALASAQHFIRTGLTAADLVAILRYAGGSVDVLQDFTADRDRLLSIVQTLMVGEGQGFEESNSDANAPDTGAAFGQNDAEFNIFNTDRQLSALQTAAGMLGQLREKKVLVYFAGGMRLNGLNNQAQLRATVNAAVRAGVAFWPIDARGLVAQAPLGDATAGSPGNLAMYSGTGPATAMNRLQQSQETLYALAADTGGKALFDSNDLGAGIRQAARSISSYYVIGYYTTNPALDGKFRRIRISLNPEITARLDYRQGYFAGKQFSRFTAADKERQLEDALMLPDPITELTIAMEIDYFQLNRAEYFVPVVVKIPARELALDKRTTIDFIGEIKNASGTTVMNVRDKITANLTGAARRPIVYDTGFTLLPGGYTIKFLARDAETGRIGTYHTSFVIPNLEKEEKRLPISSVILSSQRNGRKLVPSVTRVFSQTRDLYVYLEAYRHTPPLIALVTFYSGHEKAFETRPSEVSGGQLHFEIPLNDLPPGNYDCQVTVLDPTAQKAAFWQAPIVVVP